MRDPSQIDLFRRLQGGSTIEQISHETGMSEAHIEAQVRGLARSVMADGMDRDMPVDFSKLEPFYIDWKLLWFAA